MEENNIDINYIKNLIQGILNKEHSDINKKEIKEFPERLNFACPICGDSQKSSGKKRGNLYLENMYYKCFNDDSCSSSLVKFLSRFGVSMDMDKKLELYNYLDNNIKYNTVMQDDTVISLDRLIPLNEFINFFQNIPSRKITNMQPLTKGSAVYEYITKNRKITNYNDIYEGIYHITPKWKQPVAIFLNKAKDKVIGMQTRNLLEGDKRIFKIYEFSELYNMIYPENDMDDQEKISYNRISQIYNIFNIDITKHVNVFEGYVDSLSLPNSVGLTGIDTSLSILKDEDISLRFIYDNDISGFKKSIEYLKDKQTVFLWNKFFIDIARQRYKYRITKSKVIELSIKVKDFNKLSTFFNKPIYQIFDIDKYFSNDLIDIKYLQPIENVVQDGLLLMPNYKL